MWLSDATVLDVRDALDKAAVCIGGAMRSQYVLRAESLLGYPHKVGYTLFNAGATIKVRSEVNRGAKLAKRIASEVEVGLLIRAASSERDRIMFEKAYTGGLRVSALVGSNWADPRDERARAAVTVAEIVSRDPAEL
jgi:hypothetical protein